MDWRHLPTARVQFPPSLTCRQRNKAHSGTTARSFADKLLAASDNSHSRNRMAAAAAGKVVAYRSSRLRIHMVAAAERTALACNSSRPDTNNSQRRKVASYCIARCQRFAAGLHRPR
jgi:hypothetical protein